MDKDKIDYSYDAQQRFVVENYNWAKPFSGFFPGIAGEWGIPLWTYYVSRGQAVCSLGSRDKDGAILEFLSFNRACQLVGSQGFRTFLRLNDGPVYEPFRKVREAGIQQKLILQSHELSLEERNERLNLTIQVTYFPLVQSPLAGLIRRLSITNDGEQPVELQLLDGVPRFLPYGVTFESVKVISRHIEGMMGIDEMDGLPLFRLKQTSEDRSEIGKVEASNFYASFLQNGTMIRGRYLVDPEVIFRSPFDFTTPWSFYENSVENLLGIEQLKENRTPCAFTPLRVEIPNGATTSLYSILGYTTREIRLRKYIAGIKDTDFFTQKRVENEQIVHQIKNYAFTVSGHSLFDQYCQETFLENVMRGGMPTFFDQEQDSTAFYVYARQNGDLERDYHWFVLEPTYLSQGNGHYRSICQNRRMDTWFFPRVQTHNIKMFMNLIQLDGYNPLVIQGQRYVGKDAEVIKEYLSSQLSTRSFVEDLTQFVSKPFSPGELILWIEDHQIHTKGSTTSLLKDILNLCREVEVGDIHAGYWIDHWLYNLDLMDSYLLVYPDRIRELLWEDWSYTFYDNPDVVMDRKDKYVLRDDTVRQYRSVQRDLEKASILSLRGLEKHKVRRDKGHGEVYRTNLFVKLLCVLANKIAAMDPAGIGVEMEAEKPGWNDSLNGLPGLMGSSLCQTLELLRAFRFMKNSLSQMSFDEQDELPIFEELVKFMGELTELLEEKRNIEPLAFWDQCHQSLESYRAKIRLGIDGREVQMSIAEVKRFLQAGLDSLEDIFSASNRDKLVNETGVPYTYFVNQMSEYKMVESTESPASAASDHFVNPKKFTQRPLSLFLEGPVHYIKVFPQKSLEIYQAVHSSALYDSRLKMYKVCESLQDETHELGRITSYPRGWIENESIYTHMEFKWFLELLRGGLPEKFYEEMKKFLPPFMAPEVYGRSIVENCSFIVSSAFPDSKLHGQAFQPRLSGVTAEFLEIWSLMVAGPSPFRLDAQGNLHLRLKPCLPDWLFTEVESFYPFWDHGTGWVEVKIPANGFAFRFLGQALVIYHNPKRKSTYGPDAATISSCTFTYRDGKKITEEGYDFSDHHAQAVRNGKVQRMDISLE